MDNNPNNNKRARDIGFYALILVVLLATVFPLTGGSRFTPKYSEIIELFEQKQVESFEIKGSRLTLELRQPYERALKEKNDVEYAREAVYTRCRELIRDFLRTAGDVKFAMWSSIFATVVCRTLFSFVFGLWLGIGVVGIALAMGVDWCIKALLDIWRWKRGTWKSFSII